MNRSGSNYLYDELTIKPDCCVLTPIFAKRSKIFQSDEKKENSIANLKVNKTKGHLSFTSIKKLKYAINLLVSIADWKKVYCHKQEKSFKFKVNFITLTLSSVQKHNDNFIKRYLLQAFIKECRRRFDLRNYVWKAEAQNNGNIHFHITTDKYIHYEEIRRLWNQVQNRYGYLGEHLNPNSTDVHSVKGVANLASYMVKYMCKKEIGKRAITGSLWGCSDNLKVMCKIPVLCQADYEVVSEVFAGPETVDGDYFEYRQVHYSQLPQSLKKRFYKFLNTVRNHETFEQQINFEGVEAISNRKSTAERRNEQDVCVQYSEKQLCLFG